MASVKEDDYSDEDGEMRKQIIFVDEAQLDYGDDLVMKVQLASNVDEPLESLEKSVTKENNHRA